MNESKRLKYKTVEHYEELVKLNLCTHFNKFYILNNICHPKKENLWVDRLSTTHIHFEANVKNLECVDFKIKWTTYLAVMANQSFN
jgi:hypothetical protein